MHGTHPHILRLPLTFVANSSGTGVDLTSYKDQSSLPRDHHDAGAIVPNVKTLAIYIFLFVA